MYKTFIKKFKKHAVITAMLSVASLASFAQLAGGTYTIGASGNYATLKAAITALGAGLTAADDGDVIFELQADYAPASEFTAPHGNGAITIGTITNSSTTNKIIIRPAAGVTVNLNGTSTVGLITLSGAKYVTIDGRRGGVGTDIGLTIANTNISPYSAAIRFTEAAQNNTITYTNLSSGNSDASFGAVVMFWDQTGTMGNNSFNTISNNNISGNTAGNLIISYSGGTAASNTNNAIENNNLYNFTARGIYLATKTGADWTIKGNSIYNTTAPTATNSYGIHVTAATAQNINITKNFLGGNAPHCAGTMPVSNFFYAIGVVLSSEAQSVNIQDNTIANISSSNQALRAIHIAATGTATGTFNIERNKIYKLRRTAGTAAVIGLYLEAAAANVIVFNVINNVVSLTNANIGNESVYGIYRNAGTGTLNNFYFNTIHLQSITEGTGTYTNAIVFGSSGTTTAKNNILSNTYVNGTARSTSGGFSDNIIAYGSANVSTNSTFKYGDADKPANPEAFFQDAENGQLYVKQAYDALFSGVGTPIVGYTTDILGVTRNALTPSVGAYENNAETVLPVNIISFDAKLNNNKVQLSWVVGTETNVNRYEVERLQAGDSYIKVAQVAATGAASYTTADAQPLLGDNYYRLKSVDNDGSVAYYATLKNVKVAILNDKSVSVYPNPVTGNSITVSLANYPAGQYSYKLASVAGNVVQQGQFTNNGLNVITLSPALAKGVYVLNIVNGTNVIQSKLLKN